MEDIGRFGVYIARGRLRVLTFRLPPCRLEILRLDAGLGKYRQLGKHAKSMEASVQLITASPLHKTALKWYLHVERKYTKPLNDLGAERNKSLHFFVWFKTLG